MNNLLSKFAALPCSVHKIREYDHICDIRECKNQQVLYCSQCLLEDEKHVFQHKPNMLYLEKFLPAKIEELSGYDWQLKISHLSTTVESL
jgi:hypothetical protein